VLQLEVLVPTVLEPDMQLQLQLDVANGADRDPLAVFQLDWLQLDVL